jgi:hypothetical protein
MPRDDQNTQDPQIRYVAAVTNTRHGNGLWRGQLVHPEFGTVNDDGEPTGTSIEDVVASGDPITDTKGLGIRLFWRRPANVVAHFFIRDDTYAEAMRTAYPAFHNAAVRVLAAHIREGGWKALRRLVVCSAFPKKPFKVGRVDIERSFCINGETYRPDIVVEHAEPGYPRIELEVVNRHWPEAARLRAARTEGALVLCMNIYDISQAHILNGASASFVPPDDELLEMLSRARFADVQRKDSAEHCTFQIVWRDRETVKYLEGLTYSVDSVIRHVTDFTQSVSQAVEQIRAQKVTPWPSCVRPLTARRGPVTSEFVEDWLLQNVGMNFSDEGVLQIPALTREVDRIVSDYAAATNLPPSVRAAASALAQRRSAVDEAVNALLDLAEPLHRLLAQKRARHATATEMQARLSAARLIVRWSCRAAEDYKALSARVPAAESSVRVHRRGAGAGQTALPCPISLVSLDFSAKAESLRKTLRALRTLMHEAPEGRSLVELLEMEESALPGDTVREIASLAARLDGIVLPTEPEVDRLVTLYNARMGVNHAQ